ncbi:putative glycosyltransferase [Camellia lanceoleosa]|uniref:Glycosyltransferase n=1 Tax=Camellia lanceoleosa TaxID=1840588 RepID=A0ACC0FEG9_9ERIC|nr:putative glycosyltransferase [Camellia lanceoleosa]
MNNLLKQIIIILMFRIDWRKLLLVGSIITIAGVVVQIYTLPFPLTIWILSPPETRLVYKSLKTNMHLSEETSLARFEEFENHQADPGGSMNTSTNLNQSASIVKDEAKATRQRARLERRRMRIMKQKNPSPPPPPPHRPLPLHLLRHIRSLTSDEVLVYAKKEMENISSVLNDPDPDLYPPLFRNVSIFDRSYELMEVILKVYIYKDGAKPIFHEPHLQGIYSSEGWFMKLMEENKQFVTRDPEKAHLFYLPYSARQLQMALYVPGSHNIRRLSIFLRDHVNMLAAKYLFWNRTRGSDHFLVACHDWGSYTLTEHEELTQNTIKVLCNADVSEGIFKAGKDVSLPETTIRNPIRPLRGLGETECHSAHFLPFFLSKYVYVEHMKSSKYCLCPMGYEVNSPRIVEAIYYEYWSAFSVIVDEKDIPKLKEILSAIPLRRYLKMQINVKMLQKHFRWNARPIRFDMFHMILHSIWHSRLNQIQITQVECLVIRDSHNEEYDAGAPLQSCSSNAAHAGIFFSKNFTLAFCDGHVH